MASIFNFNEIVKGQQLQIHFKVPRTLIFKTEDSSQGTRFVVFGETQAGEKVLIPAFTKAELDTKYRYIDDIQRANNCTAWKSETKFHLVTPRFLDVEEIYLLNRDGNLRKYDSAFHGEVCLQKSKFYGSKQPTYNFEDLNLLRLKKRVSKILLENKIGTLPITENVSLIEQAASKVGVISEIDTSKLLTMKEKVNLFVQKINQLDDEIIEIFAYIQENQVNQVNQLLNINDVISQMELLNKLNIKTGLNFTKEELASFKIELVVVETDEKTNILPINLKLAYKVDDNHWSKDIVSSEFQIKVIALSKENLLKNWFGGQFVMGICLKTLNMNVQKINTINIFKRLDEEIEKLDEEIEKFVSLSDEDKRIVNALIKSQQQWKDNIANWKNKKELTSEQISLYIKIDEEGLKNTTAKIEEHLNKNEKDKQNILNGLLSKMKSVNNIQMLSYFQKSLFEKTKEYLTASIVFSELHKDLTLSFETISIYSKYYSKINSQNNNHYFMDTVNKFDNLLNNNFSEFVEISKLLPIEFQDKTIFSIARLFLFLDKFKEIEISRFFGKLPTIDEEESMVNHYLSLLNYSNYEGTFSTTVHFVNELNTKILNYKKNSREFKKYQEQLKRIKINFWKSQDFSTLINELTHIYVVDEAQEMSLKFGLEEHFLLEEQILPTNIIEDNEDKVKQKLVNARNSLKINQQLAQGFQEIVTDAFKISKLKVEKKLDEQRIKDGKWEVNDIISVNSMIGIDDIKENQLIYFKVLAKNKDKFTVIIRYLNAKKKDEYKIRDIIISNCETFNFTFTNEEIIFPNKEEILQLQELINDYTTWKDKKIKEHVMLLSKKLKEIEKPILGFVKVKGQNFFNNWEWEINIQKIKREILTTIDKEIEKYEQLIATGQLKYEANLKSNQELKDIIVNDNLTFNITESSKENIKNLNEDVDNADVTFDIIYNTEFLGNYKIQTSALNFNISRKSLIAKERLVDIKKEVAAIRNSVLIVDSQIGNIINDLTQLHDEIIKSLQNKKQEWAKLTNHSNLSVQFQNQQIIALLKLEIEQLNEKLRIIDNKISELSSKKIENSPFYNEYLTFMWYYGRATGVIFSDIKKYLYWDKNYNFIKNRLKSTIGYENFDDYKIQTLNEIKIIKTINIEDCAKSLVKISKIEFKKLSWWQKIINKLSWTWKKTKLTINIIKDNSVKNFETLIVNAEDNKYESTTNIETVSNQQNESIILPTSEPWDQWMLEKDPKIKNQSRLSRENSTDSAISSLASGEDNSDLDIDKILRELDAAINKDRFIKCSDLESSTESFSQQFNYPISRSSSNDSGLHCDSSKLVSTNPFDDENCWQETNNQNHFNYDTLADTTPLIPAPKSNFNFF